MSQYDKIIIPSNTNKYYSNIIIYKNDLGDRKMQFDYSDDVSNNVFQSSYNINDFDIFNLKYLNFLILLFLYTELTESFLFIGLGGGHLPLFIKSKLPSAQMEVVELDDQVVEGAKKMGFPDDLITVYIQDGIEFIKKCTKKYDVIVIDLDGDESYTGFDFKSIFEILENSGILAVNVYAKTGKTTVQNQIKLTFPLIKHFKNGNSNVFLCKKNLDLFENMLDDITLDSLNKEFKLLNKFSYKSKLLNVASASKKSIILN
jgi:spermidine synthase